MITTSNTKLSQFQSRAEHTRISCFTMAETTTKNATEEMERVVKKDLTDSEASCLLTTFSSQAVLISFGKCRDRDIFSLYTKIQRMVKTTTKSKLVSDYMFDGLVPMAFGQQNTVCYNM